MRELFGTLSRVRGMPWLLIAAAVGVLLLLFSGDGPSGGGEQSYSEQLEHRIAQMTDTLPGVEDVSVLVTMEQDSGGSFSGYSGTAGENRKIVGIAVTCIGGTDANIRLQILHMLCAAFNLSSDRVWIGGKETAYAP
jgi:hypothetical protein